MTVASKELLAQLQESYPVEQGYNKISLPRISMLSQDKTEGKGKTMKVVAEAGTFYIEEPTDEKDENDKTIWNKEEIGTSFKGIILYSRKQLKMYDEATEKFTSSSIYDSEDELVKLWSDKKEVAKGTPTELKNMYLYEENGKKKSSLEENRILYVLKDGKIYQLNLRGSSMYSFLTYARKVLPPGVVTEFNSEAREKGQTNWNMMTFTKVRDINEEEGQDVLAKVNDIRFAIQAEKSQYNKVEDELEVIAKSADKAF